MSKKELNVLVVENNYDHIAHIRKELKNVLDITKFSEQYVLNVYPENKDLAIHNQISTISEEIREGKREAEFLFEFIQSIIEDKNIDFIALDFLLSASEEKNIPSSTVDTTGAKLLKLIKKKYQKLPVVSFTKVADSLDTTPLVGKLLLFDLPKNFSLDFFADNLANLYKLFQEVDIFQEHRKLESHIAIVCALQKELKAVLSLDCQWEDFIHDGKKYYKGKLHNKKIIATTENKMGMPEAASATTRVIYIFKPKYVVMTGIAAGVDTINQSPLDILMPTYVNNWQSGKYKVSKNGTEKEGNLFRIFDRDYDSIGTYFKSCVVSIEEGDLKKIPIEFLESEGLSFEADKFNDNKAIEYIKSILGKNLTERSEFQKELIDLEIEKVKKEENIQDLLDTDKKMKIENRIGIDYESPSVFKLKVFYKGLECKVYNGGMVSGSAVIADGELVDERIRQRGVNGIDMEAYGFAHACSMADIKSIIIKSICDFADDEKNDIYQSAAAYASAQVFYKLFTEYIDVEQ